MSNTPLLAWLQRISPLSLLLCVLLCGCHDNARSLTAVVTLKNDGTRFSGTVVRREASSITLAGSNGETRTFLYTELSDIKYDSPGGTAAANSGSAAQSASGGDRSGVGATTAARSTGPETLELPAGTPISVTNVGILDSLVLPDDAVSLAAMDSDLKSADGKVLIPAGSSLTIIMRDRKVVDGRAEMKFELYTADFGNRHYVVSSAKGEGQEGAVATVDGAKAGTPEAKLRGDNVHLDDHSLIIFKTQTPTIFKVSQ